MSITRRFETRTRIARDEHRLGPDLIRLARRVIERSLRWRQLARERRALLELDDRLLKDIGISRYDALGEASRPFWDEPGQRWRDWR